LINKGRICFNNELLFIQTFQNKIDRRKESGALASHFSYLADVEQGSAVKTFRKQQQEKAHLPVDIWNQ
jgi:hypothetical protein